METFVNSAVDNDNLTSYILDTNRKLLELVSKDDLYKRERGNQQPTSLPRDMCMLDEELANNAHNLFSAYLYKKVMSTGNNALPALFDPWQNNLYMQDISNSEVSYNYSPDIIAKWNGITCVIDAKTTLGNRLNLDVNSTFERVILENNHYNAMYMSVHFLYNAGNPRMQVSIYSEGSKQTLRNVFGGESMFKPVGQVRSGLFGLMDPNTPDESSLLSEIEKCCSTRFNLNIKGRFPSEYESFKSLNKQGERQTLGIHKTVHSAFSDCLPHKTGLQPLTITPSIKDYYRNMSDDVLFSELSNMVLNDASVYNASVADAQTAEYLRLVFQGNEAQPYRVFQSHGIDYMSMVRRLSEGRYHKSSEKRFHSERYSEFLVSYNEKSKDRLLSSLDNGEHLKCTVDVVTDAFEAAMDIATIKKKKAVVCAYECKPSLAFLTAPGHTQLSSVVMRREPRHNPEVAKQIDLRSVDLSPGDYQNQKTAAMQHLVASVEMLGKISHNLHGEDLDKVDINGLNCYTKEQVHDLGGVDSLPMSDVVIGSGTASIVANLSYCISREIGKVASDLQTYRTIQAKNAELYRNEKPSGSKKDNKEFYKARMNCYKDYEDLKIYTGYDDIFNIVDGRLGAAMSRADIQAGKGGTKAKIQEKANRMEAYKEAVEEAILANENPKEPVDLKSIRGDTLLTKSRAIDPHCEGCNKLADDMQHSDLSAGGCSKEILKELEDVSEHYLSSNFQDHVTSKYVRSDLKTLMTSAESCMLYNYSRMASRLLISAHHRSNSNTFSLITYTEPGRYIIPLRHQDPTRYGMTYFDLVIKKCDEDVAKNYMKINYDTASFQSYYNGWYIAASKIRTFDSDRINTIEASYSRYIVCCAGLSNKPTQLLMTNHVRRMSFRLATLVSMKKVGLFDLSRHMGSLSIATLSNFKGFMEAKFTYDCSSLDDLVTLKMIINWIKGIASSKESLFSGIDIDDDDVYKVNNIKLTTSAVPNYLTGSVYKTVGELYNSFFLPIYFCPKGYHAPHTSSRVLVEVPAEFEIDLTEQIERLTPKTQRNNEFYFKWCHEGEENYSVDTILLHQAMTAHISRSAPSSFRAEITKNLDFDQPLTKHPTNQSNKSSVRYLEGEMKVQIRDKLQDVLANDNLSLSVLRLLYDVIEDNRYLNYSEIEISLARLRFKMNEKITKKKGNKVIRSYKDITPVGVMKIRDKPVKELLSLILFEDYISADTQSVRAALYKLVKKEQIKDIYSYREVITHLMGKLAGQKFISVMFDKHQRTKVDREIYILGLMEKYYIHIIEQIFFSMNARDSSEAISAPGDTKKQVLLNMMRNAVVTKRFYQTSRSDCKNGHIFFSVDQSKWSARDAFVKYITSTLSLHYMSLADRMTIIAILQKYMTKAIVVNDGIIQQLESELRKAGFMHDSNIIKLTDNLKRNYMQIRYNWFQGVFNHASSNIHSRAMEYYTKLMTDLLGEQGSLCKIQHLVHSDDAAVAISYSLTQESQEYFARFGGFDSFCFQTLGRVLKLFGITLNNTKTWAHPTIMDFISDFIINGNAIGPVSRYLATIVSPISHKSFMLDMSSLSGALMNIAKSGATPIQLAAAATMSAYYVHDTYNFTSKSAIELYKNIKKEMSVSTLPIHLFGGITMPLEMIATSGIKANDCYYYAWQISLDLISKGELEMTKAKTWNQKLQTEKMRLMMGYVCSDNNYKKVTPRVELQAMMYTVTSGLDDASAGFELAAGNSHVLEPKTRRKDYIALSKVPNFEDALKTYTADDYEKEYTSATRKVVRGQIDDDNSLDQFMARMKLAALSPKSYNDLSRWEPARNRIFIKADINKRYYKLDELLSSMTTCNILATAGENQTAAEMEAVCRNNVAIRTSKLQSMRDLHFSKMQPMQAREELSDRLRTMELTGVFDGFSKINARYSRIRDCIDSSFDKNALYSLTQMQDIYLDLVILLSRDINTYPLPEKVFTAYFSMNVDSLNSALVYWRTGPTKQPNEDRLTLSRIISSEKGLKLNGDFGNIEVQLSKIYLTDRPVISKLQIKVHNEKYGLPVRSIVEPLGLGHVVEYLEKFGPEIVYLPFIKIYTLMDCMNTLVTTLRIFFAEMAQKFHYIYTRGLGTSYDSMIGVLLSGFNPRLDDSYVHYQSYPGMPSILNDFSPYLSMRSNLDGNEKKDVETNVLKLMNNITRTIESGIKYTSLAENSRLSYKGYCSKIKESIEEIFKELTYTYQGSKKTFYSLLQELPGKDTFYFEGHEYGELLVPYFNLGFDFKSPVLKTCIENMQEERRPARPDRFRETGMWESEVSGEGVLVTITRKHFVAWLQVEPMGIDINNTRILINRDRISKEDAIKAVNKILAVYLTSRTSKNFGDGMFAVHLMDLWSETFTEEQVEFINSQPRGNPGYDLCKAYINNYNLPVYYSEDLLVYSKSTQDVRIINETDNFHRDLKSRRGDMVVLSGVKGCQIMIENTGTFQSIDPMITVEIEMSRKILPTFSIANCYRVSGGSSVHAMLIPRPPRNPNNVNIDNCSEDAYGYYADSKFDPIPFFYRNGIYAPFDGTFNYTDVASVSKIFNSFSLCTNERLVNIFLKDYKNTRDLNRNFPTIGFIHSLFVNLVRHVTGFKTNVIPKGIKALMSSQKDWNYLNECVKDGELTFSADDHVDLASRFYPPNDDVFNKMQYVMALKLCDMALSKDFTFRRELY